MCCLVEKIANIVVKKLNGADTAETDWNCMDPLALPFSLQPGLNSKFVRNLRSLPTQHITCNVDVGQSS